MKDKKCMQIFQITWNNALNFLPM